MPEQLPHLQTEPELPELVQQASLGCKSTADRTSPEQTGRHSWAASRASSTLHELFSKRLCLQMSSAGWDSQKSPCSVKGPSPAPLPAFGEFKRGLSQSGRSSPGLCSPGHSHGKGLTRTALLPCQRALLFASCQLLTQLFAKAIISIFFSLKIFLFHLEVLLLPQNLEKWVSLSPQA